MALAVVERWLLYRGLNKSQCMDCPSGQNRVPVVGNSSGSTVHKLL